MLKLAAFDLEIAKTVPDNGDWDAARPLGISCAMLHSDAFTYTWRGVPQMSREACVEMLTIMEECTRQGYMICTHNGLSFDFRTLAEETGEIDRCARLAFHHHIDTMFLVTRVRGHFIGLDGVAIGMGVEPKRHTVTLNDGSTIDDMNGALAPEMWRAGEYDAVLYYLMGDCEATLAVTEAICEKGQISYAFKSGQGDGFHFEKLPTVMEVLQIERDIVDWIKWPHPYTKMLAWTGCNLYLVAQSNGDELERVWRVPAHNEVDAVRLARRYAAFVSGAEFSAEIRWENKPHDE